ncbi:MAG: DUF4296 domain-containing protein [Bacteroidaceae bacterium]|nr:DUF4296 domain-containing protein [Bacteroidaceae bacterium]
MRKRRMRINRLFYTLLYTLVLIAAGSCEHNTDGVLSQGKMVDILYDYHLAQGMVNGLPTDSAHLVEAYMRAVFENNGVTEEEFDSSMVYYHRHNEQLSEIYADIKRRMEKEEEILIRKIGSSDMMVFTEGGDTADIWSGRQLYVLRNGDLGNKYTFRIKCDSSFHVHDKFMMEASVGFVRENMDDREFFVTLCLSVGYENGKTISQVLHLNRDGRQRLNLQAIDDEEIKSISGFFYYEGKTGGRNIGLVKDISLFRMHEQKDTTTTDITEKDTAEVADSVQASSIIIKRDTEILTPEEKRERSLDKPDGATDRKVEILEEPKVRTPNRDMRRKRRTR